MNLEKETINALQSVDSLRYNDGDNRLTLDKYDKGLMVDYLLDLLTDAFEDGLENMYEIKGDIAYILSASEYDIGKGDRIALEW